jgi:hypothetical protein
MDKTEFRYDSMYYKFKDASSIHNQARFKQVS